MATLATTSRLFTFPFVVYILVIFVVRIVQTEKCFPQVDKFKYWSQIGGHFEVNCTLVNCDSKFERQNWERDGKRVRNFRYNLPYFSESKRLTLMIDPVEESDKGEFSCRTQIHGHSQNVELIIGVEPTTTTTPAPTTTTTTTTTPIPTTTTTTTPTTTTPTPPTSPSKAVKSNGFSSTATATLKVITSPVKIIKTTKMPLDFSSHAVSTPAANSSRQLLNNLSIWTSVLQAVIHIFRR